MRPRADSPAIEAGPIAYTSHVTHHAHQHIYQTNSIEQGGHEHESQSGLALLCHGQEKLVYTKDIIKITQISQIAQIAQIALLE